MNRKLVGAVAVSVLGVALFVSTLRAEDEDEAKDKKVRKLLALTGECVDASKVCREAMKDSKNTSPEFVKRFSKAANAKAFEDMFAPIYAKHFTDEDLDGMIAFYESPAGKKVVKQRLAIQKEAGDVGRAWGAKMGAKIFAELQKEGQEEDEDDKPKEEKKKGEKKGEKKEDY